MATTTPNFGWVVPTSTDLVKDGATAIETLGDSIDASLLDLKGGTTGQVLAKNSNSDMDFVWTAGGDITGVTAGTGISGGGTSGDVTITNSMATAITTNGDLIYGTGSGTFTRRGIGSTGDVLTVSGGVPTWAAPAAGGMTLISTTTLSSTSTTISSIPSTYNNLVMVFRNVGNTATSNLSIRCNGVTTSSYIYNQPNSNPATSTYIGFDVAAGNVANATYAGQVTFFDYANTATALCKQINWTAVYAMSATPAYSLNTGNAGFFNSSAISSITLSTIAGTGTLSGSVLLYGVK